MVFPQRFRYTDDSEQTQRSVRFVKLRKKRVLSLMLTTALIGSSTLSALPTSAASSADPWNDAAAWPQMQAVGKLKKGQSYFA